MVLCKSLIEILPWSASICIIYTQHNSEGEEIQEKRKELWRGLARDFDTTNGRNAKLSGQFLLGLLYINSLMFFGGQYFLLVDVDEQKRIQELNAFYNEKNQSMEGRLS